MSTVNQAADLPDIQITVEGAPESCTTVVASVINDALAEAGFTNVTQVTDKGEPCVSYPTDAVMESIKTVRPELLTTPLIVAEKAERTDEIDEDRIDSLRTVTRLMAEDEEDAQTEADAAYIDTMEAAQA